MFTFDTEALYLRVQLWPGVGGLCLLDVVERPIRCFYSPQPDLVGFLVRLLHLVLSTRLTQYGGSFFEVTWSLSTGLQCASELANLYLDVLDSYVWQSSGGALKCLFRYTLTTVWGSWIRGKSQSTSCSVFGTHPSKCLPSRPAGSSRFLIEPWKKRVLDENSRKFGVKFSKLRKKLNIYSHVAWRFGPSFMIQSTIRGELTPSSG